MALRHAKISEMIWYGFTAGVVYFGISAYKPRYFFTFANVQRIWMIFIIKLHTMINSNNKLAYWIIVMKISIIKVFFFEKLLYVISNLQTKLIYHWLIVEYIFSLLVDLVPSPSCLLERYGVLSIILPELFSRYFVPLTFLFTL